MATRLDRQWRFRRRGKLPPGMHSAASSQPHSNNSYRSIQLTQTNQRQFYSWQPRHRYWHRPLLPPAPPPPQPSNPQHHMSSCTNTNAAPPTNHITTSGSKIVYSTRENSALKLNKNRLTPYSEHSAKWPRAVGQQRLRARPPCWEGARRVRTKGRERALPGTS